MTDAVDSSDHAGHAERVSSASHPEHEEPLPTLEGRAVCFGLELTATDILPADHAALPPAPAPPHQFADLDRTLGPKLGAGDVIVAHEVTGSAVSAPPAMAALAAAGVTAIVARRLADDVITAARAQHLVTLVVDTPNFLHTDDRVRLDLDGAKVVNLSSGDRAAIRNLDDTERARLRVALFRCPPH